MLRGQAASDSDTDQQKHRRQHGCRQQFRQHEQRQQFGLNRIQRYQLA